MTARRKKALGRGMSELVEGSFSSIVEPAAPGQPAAEPPAVPAAAAPASPGNAPVAHAPIAHTPVAHAPAAHPAPPAARPSRTDAPPVAAAARRPFEVISITSGKGGTGKSIIASNLAILMAASGRVTLLDADLGLANIHILYDLSPRWNVAHVISGERTFEEILVPGPAGVRVVPGGSGIPELASLTDPMLGSLVSGMSSLDSSTDVLLIDTPSGLDRQSLLFLLASDQVLVVTTDDVTAMTDAYAVIKTVFSQRPNAPMMIVVNQAASYAEGVGTFNRIAHVARKFLGRELALGGVIPFDEGVERSVAARAPIALTHPGAPASRAMIALAGRLAQSPAQPAPARAPFAARMKGLISQAPG